MRRRTAYSGLCLLLLAAGCAHQRASWNWTKEIIATDAAPRAIGPYSQAVRVGPWLFVSGQIAIKPSTGELVTSDFDSELRQVLENVGAILRAAGMDYRDVVQATVFVSDLSFYAKLNEVYSTYFRGDFPARCAVQVARLPRDVHVEVAVIAYRAER